MPTPINDATAGEHRDRSVLALLAAGQFVMVLDSSVMNVSISKLVADLDTTVANIQLAITAYTLVMAAFMLTGAKLGDILGRKRAFIIGLGIYGLGSLLTAAAPNLSVLLVGWSLIEGLGAVLVVPAIASLTAATYQGAQRAFAFGLLGGVSAAGVAVGPIIGGWVTQNLTWRIVFVAETVIVAVIIVVARKIRAGTERDRSARLDVVGAALSALGLALVVFAVLQSSTWGWVQPRVPPTFAGHGITPFGFAPTLPLAAVGFFVLWMFIGWEHRQTERDQPVLVQLDMFASPRLRAALLTAGAQSLALAGTFFVVPLYLQVVLGFDAFKSGKTVFPMSVAMFLSALFAPRLASRIAPRRIVRIGFLTMIAAEVLLLSSVDYELHRVVFSIAVVGLGIGMGLVASQIGNVAVSSVDEARASEVGGLQGTAQNLGQSLGTALIGAILLGGLVGAFATRVETRPELDAEVRARIVAATAQGVPFTASDDVARVLADNDVPRATADVIVNAYRDSQLAALKSALGAVAFLILAALIVTRRLPTDPLQSSSALST